MDMAQILIQKLTPEELREFLKQYDDGRLCDQVYSVLHRHNMKKFPEDYRNITSEPLDSVDRGELGTMPPYNC